MIHYNSCVLTNVSKFIANHIIRRFQEGSWQYNVDLKFDKTNTSWFDMKVDIKFEWTGRTLEDVELYTLAAKDYLRQLGKR